ncbi:14362_t:CDS:2, partial [Ambispora leptoticha]
IPQVSAKTANEWRQRTIYQLLTDRFAQPSNAKNQTLCESNRVEYEIRRYCGGTFKGIVENLDYIQNLGFDAIWISPVVKQFEEETQYGLGWHGYWAQDIYSINPHFGTEQDLKNLVEEAHKKGIWVMVDVVANHMGPQRNKTPRTDEYVKSYTPFNDTSNYHYYCNINNWNDQHEVEYCSIGGADLPLPDLDTENPQTASLLINWISSLIKTYNFDGIRIDTVKHVRKDFWANYTKSAGVFSIGEVFDGNYGYVADYQNDIDALLSYPLYYTLNSVYADGNSMYGIRDALNQNRQSFKDTTVLGNFLDGHDVPRFLSKKADQSILRNALTFILLADGIPIVYQGTEQNFNGNPTVSNGGNDPWNREALWSSKYSQSAPTYQFISRVLIFRKLLPSNFFSELSVEAWVDDKVYMFFKGHVMVVTSNYGENSGISRNITVQGNGRWSSGTDMINILRCEEVVKIDGNGNLLIKLDQEPKILYPTKELSGSGLCKL